MSDLAVALVLIASLLSAAVNAAQGMKSAQRNLATAEPKASTPPQTKQKDAFEEGFDSVL